MALSESTLASQVETALASAAGGSSAATALATAFATYFKGATLNGAPVVGAAVDSIAKPAMVSAMAFSNTATAAAGAAVLAGGLAAFWSAIAGAASTFWPAATTVTPPPGLGSLAADLLDVFDENLDDGVTRTQAAANLAEALHDDAGTGGAGVVTSVTLPIV